MCSNRDASIHMADVENGHQSHHLTQGYELVFRDINVRIDKKDILQHISGTVKPGEMMAVMGPSGAGKTTLLNCLAGRRTPESGTVTLNSAALDKPLRRRISYLMQEDKFLNELSCWDTIWYTALLRLPQSMPKEAKLDRVNAIIDTLDMRKCLATKIGSGLSGGEKKRTTIACELLTNPALMVLDELTTGLDSSTAYSLCSTIKSFAEKLGKTVVLSIHQPSSQIFNMFDKLLLIGDGQVAYYGKASRCAEYFSTELGLPSPRDYNIADHILDQVKGPQDTKTRIYETAQLKLSAELETYPAIKNETELNGNVINADEHLKISQGVQLQTQNPESENLLTRPAPLTLDESDNDALRYQTEYEAKWPTGFWLQYSVLARRSFKLAWPKILHKFRLIQFALMSFIIAVLWFQIEPREENIGDRLGFMFFVVLFNGYDVLMNSASAVPNCKPILEKERLAGYYRLSAYYLAKLSVELPLFLVLPTLLSVITFWCSGINTNFLFSVQYILTGWTILIITHSIGKFYGYMIADFSLAMTSANTTMLITMIAGGFYAPNIPWWGLWLKYLSFVTYVYNAVLQLDFSNSNIHCAKDASIYPSCLNVTYGYDGNSTTESSLPPFISKSDLLEAHTMSSDGWHMWHYIMVLVTVSLAIETGVYCMLRFRKPRSP